MGFQVVVGGVPCVSFRVCNEEDYVEDAVVNFEGGASEDGVGVQLVIDADGDGSEGVEIWVDDVIVEPVFGECV